MYLILASLHLFLGNRNPYFSPNFCDICTFEPSFSTLLWLIKTSASIKTSLLIFHVFSYMYLLPRELLFFLVRVIHALCYSYFSTFLFLVVYYCDIHTSVTYFSKLKCCIVYNRLWHWERICFFDTVLQQTETRIKGEDKGGQELGNVTPDVSVSPITLSYSLR